MSDKPPTPPHNRKLGLTGTALTKAENPKGDVQALSAVRDEIEMALIEAGFCEEAPFSWVTIAIRFGLEKEDTPHYQSVNKKYGDLPLAIEVSVEEMLAATLPKLKSIFREASFTQERSMNGQFLSLKKWPRCDFIYVETVVNHFDIGSRCQIDVG